MEAVDINNIKEDEKILWNEGNSGYIYTESISSIDLFAYKILDKKENKLIVHVFQDPKGTTVNSYIFKLLIFNDHLILDNIIEGGDRCQSSVVMDEIEIKNNVLSYSSYITPYKLMSWFEQEDLDYKFADCMYCCIGFANYSYSFETNKKEFESILIIEEYLDDDSIIKKTYDKFVKSRDLKLSLRLDSNELKEFINYTKKKL